MEQVSIQVRELWKSFKKQDPPIFQGLSADFKKGAVTYLLGGSGSGKSVLLKHILGLLKPDAGTVLIEGEELTPMSLKTLRIRFGVLFQNSALFDDQTVYENILFPLYEHRAQFSETEMAKKALDVLEAVNLDDSIFKKYPNQLSGGMKKRVALARAIIHRPKIVLYDEPTTGLDPVTRELVDQLIIKLNRDWDLTSVVVSHDISSALLLADHIFFLSQGKIIFSGDADAFLKSDCAEIQAFLKVERRIMEKKGFMEGFERCR